MTRKITLSIIAFFIFLVVLTLTNANDKAFSDIVTFVSITTGFSVTALSIIATSDFSKSLYQKEVKGDNSQTLLHQLVNNFKTSIFIFTFNIVLILIYKLLDVKSFTVQISSHTFDLVKLFASIIWFFTSLSILKFIVLVTFFSNFVIKASR